MDILRSPYYSLHYKILVVTGQWPFLSKPQKWIRGTFTLILLQSIFIPLWLGMFEVIGDINLATECIPPLVIISVSFFMFLSFMIMHKEFKTLLGKIENDWIIWSTEPEIEIIKEYAKKGKIFRVTYIVTLSGFAICFLAFPCVPIFLDLVKPLNESRPRIPILITEYGIDSEKYYNSIYLHTYLSAFFTTVLLFNGDTMFMACAQHACSIFAAMGSKLTNLVNDDYCFSYSTDNIQVKIEQDIIFCVQQHKGLIIFLQDMHKCFSFILLVIVSLNMLIISISGVKMVLNLDELAIVYRFASVTIAQIIHLFCLTIPCQQMIDHSMNISDSVYNSNWYLLPSKSRKLLLMIMRRSSEPFEFIVGKMYTYSMKNFAIVIKTSISYFTVLSSVQ